LHSRHFLVKVENEYTELSPVMRAYPKAVSWRSKGALLYLLYTTDLPTSPESTTATYQSKLSTSNELLIYKTILTSVCTYRIQLLGYGFHFQYINPGTIPIESFVHDSGHTLVHAKCGYPKGFQTPTVKEESRYYSS
jgi:hypothetical protein